MQKKTGCCNSFVPESLHVINRIENNHLFFNCVETRRLSGLADAHQNETVCCPPLSNSHGIAVMLYQQYRNYPRRKKVGVERIFNK